MIPTFLHANIYIIWKNDSIWNKIFGNDVFTRSDFIFFIIELIIYVDTYNKINT